METTSQTPPVEKKKAYRSPEVRSERVMVLNLFQSGCVPTRGNPCP